jgi:hypothetical protein
MVQWELSMPRVSAKSKEVESDVSEKRAPRRKVATRVPRKTAAASTLSAEPVVASVSRRKAPIRTAAPMVEAPSRIKKEKSLYISGSLFTLGVIAAALIGYSDTGQINTASVISERNARLAAGVGEAGSEIAAGATVIPVQNNPSTEPDGGLVRSTDPVPVLVPSSATTSLATSTASTTDGVSEDTASSSEAVLSETSSDTTDSAEGDGAGETSEVASETVE